ncbi:ABC transporter substrate-binding protein [Paenibacillus sp. MBLB4367]|uniref:ABC transporter substrate-binding protein n=1 Tax=Paenibacillus sp. MBLB4367 TaxID=3384767 RepID=UPI0039081AF7
MLEYYERLKAELSPHLVGDQVSVTLSRLAGLLYCSERNVKLILRKLTDQGWIEWKPGRGRGHHSYIRLLASIDRLVTEEAQELVEAGNLKTAFELIQFKSVSAAARERFMRWLSGHFGYLELGENDNKVDTLRFSLAKSNLTLDPVEALFSKDQHLVRQISDTLVRFDSVDQTIKPHLAHHWEVDASGMRWTFFLRKRVRFHHGKEMTADDVEFSLLRLRNAGERSSNGWLAAPIKAIHVQDRYMLQVELLEANYMFAHYMSSVAASIVPADLYGDPERNLNRHPVGTGPFHVTQHDDACCILEAYDDYFQSRAHLDRIEIWFLADGSGAAFLELTLDHERLEKRASQSDHAPARKEIDRMEMGCLLITFNINKNGPQRHPNVRKAIHHAIRRDKIVKGGDNKQVYVAQGFLPPEKPPRKDESYDPEKSRKLLDESGYAGESLRMIANVYREQEALWIQSQCAKIGLRIELDFHDSVQCLDANKIREADCCLFGVVADDNTALSLMEIYRTPNLAIRCHLGHELLKEIDETIVRIVRLTDEAERLRGILQIGDLIKCDYNAIFLFHQKAKTNYNPAIHGVSLNSFGMINFKDIWIEPNRTWSGKPAAGGA